MPRPRYLLALAGLLLAGFAAALASAPRDAGSQAFTPRAVVPMVARDEGAPPPPPPATPTPFAPTATPTPRPPTATPTAAQPTPTPAPSGLRLQGVNWYADRWGDIRVMGLVINGLNTPAEYVRVTARFYSSSGQLLATKDGYADIDIIPAGGSSPFEVWLFDPPPGVAHVETSVSGFLASNRAPITGLVFSITNIYRDRWGWLYVVGTVTNTSSTTYRYVNVLGAYVDAAGRVVRLDIDYISSDDLLPGQSSPFELIFYDAPPGLENLNLLIWTDASR